MSYPGLGLVGDGEGGGAGEGLQNNKGPKRLKQRGQSDHTFALLATLGVESSLAATENGQARSHEFNDFCEGSFAGVI